MGRWRFSGLGGFRSIFRERNQRALAYGMDLCLSICFAYGVEANFPKSWSGSNLGV